jgi:hypothetical protein
MIKTLHKVLKSEQERFVAPRSVQQFIPIRRIWSDGIFQVGNRFSKSYRFADINYSVADPEEQSDMFYGYCDLLNALDVGTSTKITINNRQLNRADFEQSILIKEKTDGLDAFREEYNQMLVDKAVTANNNIVQEKYITVTVAKRSIEEARTYFARIGGDLHTHLSRLSSGAIELDAVERLRVFHDFFRIGEEVFYRFDLRETMRKGHSFKDYICPDSLEFNKDHFVMGGKYGRVLFLREYASNIKDKMITELCEMNLNLMLSIDIIPIPTDEAVREIENRLLGVETNITNWVRHEVA